MAHYALIFIGNI